MATKNISPEFTTSKIRTPKIITSEFIAPKISALKIMTPEINKFIISFVKKTISEFVTKNVTIELPKKYPDALNEKHGIFVTLTENNELRGCIGFIGTKRKIIENLRDAAIEACLDSRFLPVCAKELPHIDFEVSVLAEPALIKAKNPEELLNKIKPKKDGLIIEYMGCSGLFLPQVWMDIPEKEEFLRHLCLKAGIPIDAWKKGAVLYKFSAEIIKGKFK